MRFLIGVEQYFDHFDLNALIQIPWTGSVNWEYNSKQDSYWCWTSWCSAEGARGLETLQSLHEMGKKNSVLRSFHSQARYCSVFLTLSSFFITRAICIKIGSMPLMSLCVPAAYSSLEILILCGIYIVPFTPKHFTVITNWYKRITSSTPDKKSPLWWNQLFNHVERKKTL